MTRLRSNNRDLTHWIVMLAVGAAVYFIGCHLSRAAGLAEAPPGQQPATGIDWTFWIALVSLLLGLASHVLHYIAPRTKTKVDDEWRDRVDLMLGWWQTAAPKPAPRDPQAGKSFLGGMIGIALGSAILIAIIACTAAQRTQVVAEAKRDLINCTAQDLGSAPHLDLATLVAVVNLAALERAKCSTTGSLDWQCVKRDLISQGAVLGGCTLVAMVTAAASAFTAPGDRLSAATPVLPGRAELEQFRAAVAPGVTYHTGAGDF